MKNLILITFLFLLNNCGYTSVYKDIGNQDFQIIVTQTKGDREINNLIKNELSLYSNKNSINKYNLSIDTRYKKTIFIKNSAGVATDYKLSVDSVFTIFIGDKIQEFTLNENLNVKDQTNTFEQNLYEKNVKKNFAESLREKLISEILTMK